MNSNSTESPMTIEDRGSFGFARVRDAAFDAVSDLWRRRKSEGMQQIELAAAMGKDPAWVSRKLSGPANWTMRTFGEFIEALNGEAEIIIHGVEDKNHPPSNFNAYDGYGLKEIKPSWTQPQKSYVVSKQTTYHQSLISDYAK